MKPKFIVIGRPNCPWCDKAVNLIDEKGFEYRYHSITSKADPVFLLMGQFDLKTVPQIFAVTGEGQHYIGGYNQLAERFNNTGGEK